jgi:hypothetical protein
MGNSLAIAVAAINKSAMSICLRFRFRLALISTADFTTVLSKGSTLIYFNKSFQKSI